jgi:hypothetical protein
MLEPAMHWAATLINNNFTLDPIAGRGAIA